MCNYESRLKDIEVGDETLCFSVAEASSCAKKNQNQEM